MSILLPFLHLKTRIGSITRMCPPNHEEFHEWLGGHPQAQVCLTKVLLASASTAQLFDPLLLSAISITGTVFTSHKVTSLVLILSFLVL